MWESQPHVAPACVGTASAAERPALDQSAANFQVLPEWNKSQVYATRAVFLNRARSIEADFSYKMQGVVRGPSVNRHAT